MSHDHVRPRTTERSDISWVSVVFLLLLIGLALLVAFLEVFAEGSLFPG